jgi:asparagine synthase (glutamine-hydrolysing)
MCGLAGYINFSAVNIPDVEITRKMISKLNHRGPDDAGTWHSHDGRIQLAHARLAIQDLSPLGHQPMLRDDDRFVIVFNGEIYNFEALRLQLQQRGHLFRSMGDTEVVLAAYQEWGAQCVEHFNGMFALAILDQGRDGVPPSLFLARDRAGEKPLYYMHSQGQLVFASELKALPHGGAINLKALNHYLALGYVPADQCLFEGVHKLPPAHCAKFMLQTGELRLWRYWSLPANTANAAADGQALAEQAGSLIEDSVRLRMVADVPVGVLLSGGLDSSLVAAAAARVSSRPVQTFTIALPGSPLDEAHHAKKVADYLGTQHHVLELDKPSLGLLDGFAPLIDEPIADSSILPAWMVFGLARQQVTVALGGDGGDELFGGYTSYQTVLKEEQAWANVPEMAFSAAAATAALLPGGIKGRNKLVSLAQGPTRQFIYGTPYFDTALRKRLLNKAVHVECGLEAPSRFLSSLYAQGETTLDRMTRMDFGSILPDDFLVKVDRASMTHSLEVRAPMLDHRLIEFCFSQVPDHWKIEQGETRRLQRLLAERWLPPDLDTRRKQGFSIPVNEWLRAEGENKLMSRMESLPDVIQLDQVRALVRGHLAGRANGGRLFALIMLAIAMQNRQL